jgi:hypothetical protein
MRLRPEPELADTIFTLAAASNNLPAVEIMWGVVCGEVRRHSIIRN